MSIWDLVSKLFGRSETETDQEDIVHIEGRIDVVVRELNRLDDEDKIYEDRKRDRRMKHRHERVRTS